MAEYFDERLKDEIRDALPVLALAQKHFAMRKIGASEWEDTKNHSFKVNTTKNVWSDFGNGKDTGDVFQLEMYATKCTFVEACQRLADMTGVRRPQPRRSTNGHAKEEPPPADPADYGAPERSRFRPTITETIYPYMGSEGIELYQVVRKAWLDEQGRPHKVTPPRRAHPDEKGVWIWGIKAGEYLRVPADGNWRQVTDERRAKFPDAETCYFEAVAPTLYRLPELRDHLHVAGPEDPLDLKDPVFVPEGEKDADTLVAWGLVATTSMGGTSGWQSHFPEYLRGADVVILVDNDREGREFGKLKAASLRGIARRVRILDWRDHWPSVPDKADITDWRDKAGGTREKLLEIALDLPEWKPEPPETSFGAVRFVDLDKKSDELEWLVKGILTRGEVSLWYGPTQCGKSFLVTDLAFAIARDMPTWMGQKLRPGLVVYQAGESGRGFRKRMRGYRNAHRLAALDIPFVALTSQVDLFFSDKDIELAITEIKGWRVFYDLDLELVVIDTFNVASVGADENSSKDVGAVLRRARRIANETGAHVAIIHHVNAHGDKPRGHTSLRDNADSAIEISLTGEIEDNRPVRRLKVTKQRDGETNIERFFVLRQVATGVIDTDGDAETSCVVTETGARIAQLAPRVIPPGWAQLNEENQVLFHSLDKLLAKKGRAPPPEASAPIGARAVTIAEWQDAILELQIGHEPVTETLKNKIRARIRRACQRWAPDRTDGPRILAKGQEWIWRTGRKVAGVDPLPRSTAPGASIEPQMILAPGETPGSEIDDIV